MKRKRARHISRHRQLDASDLADQALDHCRNIRTLASLLRATDPSPAGEPLDIRTIINTATLIGEQAGRLQALIHDLHQRVASHPPRG